MTDCNLTPTQSIEPNVAWSEERLPHRSPVVPLTAAGLDKTGLSSSRNQVVRFLLFRAGASGSCSIRVATHFGNSAGNRLLQARQAWRVENSGIMDPTSTWVTSSSHPRHLDWGGSQGVQSVPRQSWRALHLAWWSDVTRDFSQRHYADRLHQARGNAWGTA
jgi:hypothetical protein